MYILRHPDRRQRWARWCDELGWIWTLAPDRATAYEDIGVACLAAMEVEQRHALDMRGSPVDRDGEIRAWEEARREALRQPPKPAIAMPEARIEWTPEQLAREAEYADRRLRGGW